ncbi:MAG: Lipopolysaccharide biosynthesis protein, partial [Desulfofundulus kuznetsovii]
MNNDQMPGNIPEVEEQVVDLRLFLNILRKRYPLIILVTLLCVIVSGLISFFILKPVYETHTTLLVAQATDKQQTAGAQNGDLNTLVDSMSRIPVLTMNTYIGELKSDAMMQNVIKKMRLEERGYTVRSLSGSIKASVAKDSNLIDVTVDNGDPYLAVAIANTLSQEFLEFISEKNKEQMQRSVEFMQSQTGATDSQLEMAVAELTRFDSEPRGVTYLQQNLSAKLQDLNNYQSELTRVEVEMQ